MKSPVWVVKEVQPKEDYTLLLTFADGAKKVYILPLKIRLFFCVPKLSVVLLSGMTI